MRNRIVVVAFASLIACGIAGTPSLHAEQSAQAPQETSGTTITKILRGKTVCAGITDRDQICGIEHWSVYVHQDGSRTMHVASETTRNEEVRHTLITVDADGTPHEAFMHNRSKTGAIGSSFAVLSEKSVETVINDSGFGSDKKTLTIANIDAPASADSLSTGPASADGLHFLKYDFETAGEQPRNIYWMGGSRQGTMVGSFRPTTLEYLGEVVLKLPDGQATTTDHFRMMTGTEIWLTKEDRVVVRMDPKFGNIAGTRYELTEYEVIGFGP
jgi:hypothetical protein